MALVDALAEPRDREPAHDLGDPAVLDVGDEEPGRVRAEVDGSDAHGGQASSTASAAIGELLRTLAAIRVAAAPELGRHRSPSSHPPEPRRPAR